MNLVQQVMNNFEADRQLFFVGSTIFQGDDYLRHVISDLKQLLAFFVHKLRVVQQIKLDVVAYVRYLADIVCVVLHLKVLLKFPPPLEHQ